MSEAGQHSSKDTAATWTGVVAPTGMGPAFTSEEIKSELDVRPFGQVVIDKFGGYADIPEYAADNKLRAAGIYTEGIAVSGLTAFSALGDFAVGATYDQFAGFFNNFARGQGFEEIYEREKFFAFTHSAQDFTFGKPIENYILVGPKGQEKWEPNPVAETERAIKSLGVGTGDTIFTLGTMGGGGAMLGATKNAILIPLSRVKYLSSLNNLTTRTLKYAKELAHVDDAVDLMKKATAKYDDIAKIKEAGGELSEEMLERVAKLEKQAAKYEQRAIEILDGKRPKSALEKQWLKLEGKITGTQQTPISTKEQLDAFIAETITVGPTSGVRTPMKRIPGIRSPAQRIKRLEDKIDKLDDASDAAQKEKLTGQLDEAYRDLKKELDKGVNKVADQIGVPRYSAQDAMQLSRNSELANTGNYFANVWEGFRSGGYSWTHFCDPFRDPKMEAFLFPLGTGLSYAELGRKAEEDHNTFLNSRELGKGQTESDLDKMDAYIAKQKAANGPVIDDRKLNGKEIDPTNSIFNKESAGIEQNTEQPPAPQNSNQLDAVFDRLFPTQ